MNIKTIKLTKILESLAYRGGHNNNFYDTNLAIDSLEKKASKEFIGRKLTDIGCGDGVNTLKIAKVLKANTVLGYEMSKPLADEARKNGLDIIDQKEGQMISGDLGVLWGVAHHFDNPEEDIYQYMKGFKSFIIREPTDWWRLFEAGKRYREEKMTQMIEKAAERCNKKVSKIIVNEAKSVLYFIN